MTKAKPLGAWRNISDFTEMFRTGKIDDEILLVADKEGRVGWGKVLTTNDKPEKNVWTVLWFNMPTIDSALDRMEAPVRGGTTFSKEIKQGSLRYFQPFVVPVWVENPYHVQNKGFHASSFGRHTRDAHHRRRVAVESEKTLPVNPHVITRKQRRKPADLSWVSGKPALVAAHEERERQLKEKKDKQKQEEFTELQIARTIRQQERIKIQQTKKPATIVVKKRAKK